MHSSVSPVLDILYDADALGEPLRALLEQVAQVVKDHAVQRKIADWPFEQFWGNPSEPQHSKLLGYLIDPDEQHRCGSFLLRKFVAVLVGALEKSDKFPAISDHDDGFWDECCVDAETRFVPDDDDSGQIDLLITSPVDWVRDNRKFAIIVENKIHRAPNQPKQLWKYVAEAERRKFQGVIFVFFLPLTFLDCKPQPDDLKAIQSKVTYAEITFETHIREWLTLVLGQRWPDNLPASIREHLSYYRNLIDYLINQRKGEIMSNKICEQLRLAARNVGLPTWGQVQALKTTTRELEQNLGRMLRGKFLRTTGEILRANGSETKWVLIGRGITIEDVASEFDECFGQDVALAIAVNDAVEVCIGWNVRDGFRIGYLRTGSEEKQSEFAQRVIALANARFEMPQGQHEYWIDPPYYKYKKREDISYENCHEDSTARKVADELLGMRDQLKNILVPDPH